MIKKVLSAVLLLALSLGASAQKIVYSTPDREDSRRINFEVIGKIGGNYLVYKNVKDRNYIVAFNNEMQEIAREEHTYLPDERLINVDFFAYPDFAFAVYQYQKKNVVYCNAIRIDGRGRRTSDVLQLDTSHIGFNASNRIYTALSSEDKNRLMVFKINSRNKERFVITTLLLDTSLATLKRSTFPIRMNERSDHLDEFALDNAGDMVFTRFNRASNETIESTSLYWKPAQADSPRLVEVPHKDLFLDDPTIKVDNANGRYFLTSFSYKQKRGNIDGFYFFAWDKASDRVLMNNTVTLGEDLRQEAKGEANLRTAFNDYFIRDVILRRDGGFLINSEAYYTTSRFNNWNRWNYLYGAPMSSLDYYAYAPLYGGWLWRRNAFGPNQVRHHADNITILSFNPEGKLEWSNVIHKEQFDDEGDDRISFRLLNTGGQLHYLFNLEEKRSLLLNDFTLNPDGTVNRNPTLKGLDRGFEFMPKWGKQVSARQMVIPCFYRNYVCFAKIDF